MVVCLPILYLVWIFLILGSPWGAWHALELGDWWCPDAQGPCGVPGSGLCGQGGDWAGPAGGQADVPLSPSGAQAFLSLRAGRGSAGFHAEGLVAASTARSRNPGKQVPSLRWSVVTGNAEGHTPQSRGDMNVRPGGDGLETGCPPLAGWVSLNPPAGSK